MLPFFCFIGLFIAFWGVFFIDFLWILLIVGLLVSLYSVRWWFKQNEKQEVYKNDLIRLRKRKIDRLAYLISLAGE